MCFEITKHDSTVLSGGQSLMARMEYLSIYENEDDGDSTMCFQCVHNELVGVVK